MSASPSSGSSPASSSGGDVRAHEVTSLVGGDEPESREDSGRGRHEHRRHPELLGERARVQRARAPERDEREVARVETLLDGDDAQRPHHLGVDDVDHGGRVELAERSLAQRPRRARSRRAATLGQASEQEVGVGHGRRARRRSRSTPGPGSAPRALGADAHALRPRPARRSTRRRLRPCAPRASAAGPGSRRRRARALAARLRRRSRRRRWTFRPCRRTARSRIRRAQRCVRRRRHPRPGPRAARTQRALRPRSSVGDSPGRAHDERFREDPRHGMPPRERTEVAREHGAEVGVDDGRRGALVLTELGRDLVRRDHVCGGVAPPDLRGDALSCSVSRNEKRRQTAIASASRSGSESRSSGASSPVRAHSSLDADAALERDERRRDARRTAGTGARAGLPPEVEEMLEARRRHERRPCAAPLEQRVRRDRRPVREAIDVLEPERCRGGDNGFLLARAVGTLAVRTFPSATRTASVNVPPTSIPRRRRMREPDSGQRTLSRVSPDVHRLVCLGLSHRTAPVELRERIGALGFGAERCPAVVEHATLQTCYRVELYARLDVRGRGCARRADRRALPRARRRARAPDRPSLRPLPATMSPATSPRRRRPRLTRARRGRDPRSGG